MTSLKTTLITSAFALALSTSTAFAANVVETAQGAGVFNTLLAAATEAGLAEALATTENITVFAPTDDAFAALPAGTVESLLLPENRDQLIGILTMHVLPVEVMSGDLAMTSVEVETLNPDQMLTVTKSESGVTVAGSTTANVISADVDADNGVIHVIDTVLLPN